MILASLLLTAELSVKAWRSPFDRFPRPWLPKPFWRVMFRLNHRTMVVILQVAPKASFANPAPFPDPNSSVVNFCSAPRPESRTDYQSAKHAPSFAWLTTL